MVRALHRAVLGDGAADWFRGFVSDGLGGQFSHPFSVVRIMRLGDSVGRPPGARESDTSASWGVPLRSRATTVYLVAARVADRLRQSM